jgi:ABC-type transport system involved in cytochrome c biogenesis permease component
VRAFLLLLRKDLRLVVRSPIVLLILIGYPLLVAFLVAAALQSEDRRPALAVVNLDTPGRTVQVGDRRLSVDDYLERLDDDVDLERLDEAAAARELDAGRVTAVLTIPAGFIADLQSGVRQPALRLVTSRRSPLEGQAITRRLEAAVYRFNQGLAATYVQQVVRLVDLVVNGGQLGFFGRTGDALGLVRTRVLVVDLQKRLAARGEATEVQRLDEIVNFIDETQSNLDLARPAASSIANPIALDVSQGANGREPLSAFGVAGALLVSLALVGVLLGAAGVAAEREENTLVRLRRGLVAPWLIVVEKVVFAALACIVVGVCLLVAVATLTDLAIGRWGFWVPALALSGLAFGAFGAVVGAAARETRTALLAALMLALPLVFVGLIPGDTVAAIARVVPFGPAFSAFRALLVEPRLPESLVTDLLLLGGLTAALAAAASLLLARRNTL